MEVAVAMRLNLASAFMFTDVESNNEKARDLTAWLRQVRAVVSLPDKPTGVGADNTRAGLTSTHPGTRTRQSWQRRLSLRAPGKSRHGADNEHPTLRDSGSRNRGSY
jgi:hypothetical protein